MTAKPFPHASWILKTDPEGRAWTQRWLVLDIKSYTLTYFDDDNVRKNPKVKRRRVALSRGATQFGCAVRRASSTCAARLWTSAATTLRCGTFQRFLLSPLAAPTSFAQTATRTFACGEHAGRLRGRPHELTGGVLQGEQFECNSTAVQGGC